MTYKVYFLEDGEKDLFTISEYVEREGYPLAARELLAEMKKVCKSLSNMPKRGHIPPELERVGVFEYREIHLKVYRIIYQIIKLSHNFIERPAARDSEKRKFLSNQVIDSSVFIHCILDGRRDIQSILHQRMLR